MEYNSSKSFFLSPTNKMKFQSLFLACPNGIPTKIRKLLKDEISSHLSDIFYGCIPISPENCQSHFCTTLSSTAVTIVQCFFCQILKKNLEKVVYNRITKFLNENNLIYLLQFGFRHNYSTNHALINVTEDARKNLMKEKLDVAFL